MPTDEGTRTDLTQPGSGEQAWRAVREEAMARRVDRPRLAGIHHGRVARGVFRRLELLEEHEEAIAARFADDLAGELRQSMGQLRTLAHAMFFASAQLTIQADTAESEWASLLERARVQRQVGLSWLDILVGLGQVDDARASAIRQGSGHDDLAADLQGLGSLLAVHWGVLAPLQAVAAREELRMTEETPGEMGLLGTRLLQEIDGRHDKPEPEIDWRGELMAVQQLLEERWNFVRACAILHFTLAGQTAEAEELVSLQAINRVDA